MQDDQSPPDSPFHSDLRDYVRALRLYKAERHLEKDALAILQAHDFSSARATIIASVPTTHEGSIALPVWLLCAVRMAGIKHALCFMRLLDCTVILLTCSKLLDPQAYDSSASWTSAVHVVVACYNVARGSLSLIRSHCLRYPVVGAGSLLHKWGHMKLRKSLSAANIGPVFKSAPLVVQCSSMGRLDSKWLEEFAESCCSGCRPSELPTYTHILTDFTRSSHQVLVQM